MPLHMSLLSGEYLTTANLPVDSKLTCGMSTDYSWLSLAIPDSYWPPTTTHNYNCPSTQLVASLYTPSREHIENTAINNSSNVALPIHCYGNLFIELLPGYNCLFWFHYSGLQPSCHSIFMFMELSVLQKVCFVFNMV